MFSLRWVCNEGRCYRTCHVFMPAQIYVIYPEQSSSIFLRNVCPQYLTAVTHNLSHHNASAHSSTCSHEWILSQILILNCFCIRGFTYLLDVGARCRFLGAFTKQLRKAALSFVMSLCPYEELCSQLEYSRENLSCVFSLKFVLFVYTKICVV